MGNGARCAGTDGRGKFRTFVCRQPFLRVIHTFPSARADNATKLAAKLKTTLTKTSRRGQGLIAAESGSEVERTPCPDRTRLFPFGQLMIYY